MPESDPAAEKELGRLRRLPENRVCPNCLKEERLGFTAICVRFRTFVCNNCKSAHQSFSHRCKDAAQSAWQMAEVRELEERKGGGNKAACQRWLANVPDGERPTEDNPLEVFKRFVERAYIEERWASPAAGAGEADEGGAAPSAAASPADEEGRHRRHHKDPAAGAPRTERRRRHRSRHRDRAATEPADLWQQPAADAWPEEGAGEGPAGSSGWHGGPTGPVFQMAPPNSYEDAYGAAYNSPQVYPAQGPVPYPAQGPAAYPAQGRAAAAWMPGSSPVNVAGSDGHGWNTPSASTDCSIYTSPTGRLSFGCAPREATARRPEAPRPAPGWGAAGRGPGGPLVLASVQGHLHSIAVDSTNPWADAPDLLPVERMSAPSSTPSGSTDLSPGKPRSSCSANSQNLDMESVSGFAFKHLALGQFDPRNPWMPVIDATNPWADEVLRPKALVNSAGLFMGKTPVIGF